ncbi:MAG: type 2 isopentenyl-diphosphate Delta-isomerase [Methanobacteriota archaeon]|nr:MAG: type 2 isopentenyl-diphosphate Delta-isomerase [Euryarchaeota archaeon]
MTEGEQQPGRIIEMRKNDHVDICANEDLSPGYYYWDDVKLVHRSLPEIDLADVDTSVTLFGKKLSAPLVISAMTGGYDKAREINGILASVAEEHGLGMGVGSQRAALENPELADTYSVVGDYDIPLRIANLGLPQLVRQRSESVLLPEDGRAAMDMIGADVLAIHLNYLQEVVQPEGDTCARGGVEAIRTFASEMPVIAKETGAGISRQMALVLKKTGVRGFDIGGLGGTSFSAVEYYRARKVRNEARENIGKAFWDWGIPSPVSVVTASVGLPLIATGGLRTGLDVARALCIGASCGGMAGRLLPSALEGKEALEREVRMIVDELRAAMFLVGSREVEELVSAQALVTGRTREWLDHVME